jgi:1-acyl-sn-glycerol-3-phosphate acyltransferase
MELSLAGWLGTWGPYGDTVSFIAKEDIKKWPLLGTISKAYQSIFVDRNLKSNRANTL